MSLCIVCKSIPFRKIINRDEKAIMNDGFRFNSVGRTSPMFSDHLSWNERLCTVSELMSRAETCRLCANILSEIKEHKWQMFYENLLRLLTWDEAKTAIPRDLMIWIVLLAHPYYRPSFRICLGNSRERKTRELVLDFRKSLNSSLKSQIDRVVFQETVHPNTLNQMLSWLDECNNSHPKCSHLSTRLVPLPTRVLDVSALPDQNQMLGKHQNWGELFQKKDCKLFQSSNGQTGRYAALSYCWGADLPSTTTTINLQAHKSAIDFSTLPQTLKDAIVVVRWLGIEYIWIDCLCILQDSKADWEHESARMADVYSNAHLTIAASRAEHCGEGFLGVRKVRTPLCVDIEDDEGPFKFYFQQRSDRSYEFSQALDRRAWAAQESLLSHRVLRFNEGQMTWGCDQFYGTEDGSEDHAGLIVGRIEKIAESVSQPWQPNGQQFAIGHWARFIESYSARQLTYDTDALPAISGIIQEIQRLTGDTYYSGLWKQNFLDGLLWRPEARLGSPERVEGHPQTPRRRHEWIAPSWSWASVQGRITHLLWYSDIEYSACLEECSVTHCGIDPFGALKEGFARLTGPVTFVTDVQAEFEVPDGRGCMIQLRNGISTEGIVFFDFVHHMSCDVLMITSSRGICIEKVEHMTNTYVRIGVVIVRSVQHTGDKVAYNLVGNLAAKGDWRSLTTSDHVPPRSIILV